MICPLCNKNTSLIIARQIRDGQKRKVYYCQACQLGMLQNRQSEAQLRSLYKGSYRKKFTPVIGKQTNPQELFDVYSSFQGDRVKLIKKFLTKKTRLLDIGCSAGMFLSQVKKYVREVVGIDYDSRSAVFAAKKCSCRTFDVNIRDSGIEENYFDVICIFQTLEHLKDPYMFVKEAAKYLKPGGVIYIEVPNLHDALVYAYDLPNHQKFYFHLAHLWYFTAKSLGLLMKKSGFKGKINFTQDYNILNHMHWISIDAPQRDCVAGLSAPALPLRNINPTQSRALKNFILKTDNNYKELLAKLGLTSNIVFIGTKTG